jgi:cob(I)alamin adenosyltransferase
LRIYTGTGDKGKTSLIGGERVSKGDPRVGAYGEVDELSAFLGCLATTLPAPLQSVAAEIDDIQSNLFIIGAYLATSPAARGEESLPPFPDSAAADLETAIDRMTAEMPPLAGFILPGGHFAAALAHVARCVCRRAERGLVRCKDAEGEAEIPFPQAAFVYINRLSDWLFVFARYVNHITGETDRLWKTE